MPAARNHRDILDHAAIAGTHFKVFKPISEVTPEDLPPSWMKQAIVSNGDDLSCC